MAVGEEMVKDEVGVEEQEKRLMHYSSFHQILLVGEGDFSFSLCLAHSFAWNQLVTCVLYSNLVVLSPVYFWETVEGELFSLFGCHDWKRKKHARSMEELIHFDTHIMG